MRDGDQTVGRYLRSPLRQQSGRYLEINVLRLAAGNRTVPQPLISKGKEDSTYWEIFRWGRKCV